MHELALAQAVLAQATEIAKARRVAQITLRIGPLAGVEPKLLAAAFPFAAAGTCCANAKLCFETIAVRVACRTCGVSSAARPNRLLCAACGGWRVALLSGDEMRLESMEFLEEETAHV